MGSLKFKVVGEKLGYDDVTLVESFERLKSQIETTKKVYECEQEHLDEKRNYLGFKMARLAYELVREEYDSVLKEAIKRGLITESGS